jgi:hypothetical protein
MKTYSHHDTCSIFQPPSASVVIQLPNLYTRIPLFPSINWNRHMSFTWIDWNGPFPLYTSAFDFQLWNTQTILSMTQNSTRSIFMFVSTSISAFHKTPFVRWMALGSDRDPESKFSTAYALLYIHFSKMTDCEAYDLRSGRYQKRSGFQDVRVCLRLRLFEQQTVNPMIWEANIVPNWLKTPDPDQYGQKIDRDLKASTSRLSPPPTFETTTTNYLWFEKQTRY